MRTRWQPWRRRSSPGKRLAVEVLALVHALGFLLALVWVIWLLITRPNEEPLAHPLGDTIMSSAGFDLRCGEPSARPFIVTFVYEPSKAGWLEPAATEFMRRCPNTQLRLIALDDIEAAKQIVAGELAPSLWAPNDSLMLDYLDARWQQRRPQEPLALTRLPSLVTTPMVLLIWRDRLELLDRLLPGGATGPGAWAQSACAGIGRHEFGEQLTREQLVPYRWAELWQRAWPSPTRMPAQPSVAELERWGRVRIAHASPSRSAVGLIGLYLIAYDYLRASEGPARRDHASPGEVELHEALTAERGALLAWLRRCEAGLPKPLPDARLLTETMFNFGEPASDGRGFDAVMTTEQLAFVVLDRVNSHEAALAPAQLAYPRDGLVLDHPVASFADRDPRVLAAGERFVAFLREDPVQAEALALGFRPVSERLDLRGQDRGPNPFARLRRHGVELEPEVADAPRLGGDDLFALIEIWAEATGRD